MCENTQQNGQNDEAKHLDPLTQSQVRYQAAPHPEPPQILALTDFVYVLAQCLQDSFHFIRRRPSKTSAQMQTTPNASRVKWRGYYGEEHPMTNRQIERPNGS